MRISAAALYSSTQTVQTQEIKYVLLLSISLVCCITVFVTGSQLGNAN